VINAPVTTHRPAVHARVNGVPAMPKYRAMPDPIGAPNTVRAEAAPPITAVTAISANARSRRMTNGRPCGTSYATSRPICSAAMPLDALHNATARPITTAASDPRPVWPAADLSALPTTADAPGGSACCAPLTSRSTVAALILTRLARPSSAMMAGNSARNQ